MEKFLLSLLCLLTVGFAGKAEVYELVTNVSDLGDEATCIIVNSASKKALGTTQNTSNRAAVDVTISNDNKIEPGSDVAIIKISKLTDGYSLYVTNGASIGYLYAASSSSNHLKTHDSESAASIVISGNNAEIKFKENSRNLLRYNSSNKLFSCYASGQQDVQIFKKSIPVDPTTCATPVAKIGETVLANNGKAYVNDVLTLSCATEGGVNYLHSSWRWS